MYLAHCKKSYGFTLVEMLVVLVVMSLTTTLLVEGLGTTWRNFEKLNSQQLIINKKLIPKKWFIDSFKGAQLYHPYKPNFEGDDKSVFFTTTLAPGIGEAKPSLVRWQIQDSGSGEQTLVITLDEQQDVPIAILSGSYQFEYLSNDRWSNSFSPDTAELPQAIRIVDDNNIWAYSIAGRPVKAYVPQSIVLYGQHEI